MKRRGGLTRVALNPKRRKEQWVKCPFCGHRGRYQLIPNGVMGGADYVCAHYYAAGNDGVSLVFDESASDPFVHDLDPRNPLYRPFEFPKFSFTKLELVQKEPTT